VMMFGGAVFRVQCVFPNMETEAVPNIKYKIGKNHKKEEGGGAHCW
jgi:hypothetical protein